MKNNNESPKNSGREFALSWRQLPPLPDPCGFASPITGVDGGGTLIVAGGANFPGRQLWEGGRKTWHDRIFVLAPKAHEWTPAGRLPYPLAYAGVVTTDDGILCAGGSNSEKHFDDVFLMRWRNGAVSVEALPSLPAPLAMQAAARVGSIVYVAGGLNTPASAEASGAFYALDLKNTRDGWKILPAWPGPGRFQAVAAADGDAFYLFSGLRHEPTPDGTRKLTYLRDAYCYTAAHGWKKLPDLPHAAAAAATPAPVSMSGHILLIGGVDGESAGASPSDFTHVPQRIQAYCVRTNAWSDAGQAPVGRVCVSTAFWDGRWVLPSGERSAGVRSPEVWALEIKIFE